MQQKFESELSEDQISLFLIKKSHKAIFTLKSVENSTEHVSLISKIETFLRAEDIKWIEFPILSFDPIIPKNSITYINKFNGNLVCHIEDFVKFYFANIRNFVQITHFKYNAEVNKGGWTVVKDPKKCKREKFANLIKELETLDHESV